MSFDATTWVEDLGFFKSFSIYSGVLAITTLGLPLVYIYGKKIRAFTAGKLTKAPPVVLHRPQTREDTTDDEPKSSSPRRTYPKDDDGPGGVQTDWPMAPSPTPHVNL